MVISSFLSSRVSSTNDESDERNARCRILQSPQSDSSSSSRSAESPMSVQVDPMAASVVAAALTSTYPTLLPQWCLPPREAPLVGVQPHQDSGTSADQPLDLSAKPKNSQVRVPSGVGCVDSLPSPAAYWCVDMKSSRAFTKLFTLYQSIPFETHAINVSPQRYRFPFCRRITTYLCWNNRKYL